eukprot:scaffold103498_cov67-Phaeocystis_antarctica.AAC.1
MKTVRARRDHRLLVVRWYGSAHRDGKGDSCEPHHTAMVTSGGKCLLHAHHSCHSAGKAPRIKTRFRPVATHEVLTLARSWRRPRGRGRVRIRARVRAGEPLAVDILLALETLLGVVGHREQ